MKVLVFILNLLPDYFLSLDSLEEYLMFLGLGGNCSYKKQVRSHEDQRITVYIIRQDMCGTEKPTTVRQYFPADSHNTGTGSWHLGL